MRDSEWPGSAARSVQNSKISMSKSGSLIRRMLAGVNKKAVEDKERCKDNT